MAGYSTSVSSYRIFKAPVSALESRPNRCLLQNGTTGIAEITRQPDMLRTRQKIDANDPKRTRSQLPRGTTVFEPPR